MERMEKLLKLLNEYKPLNKGVHYEYNNRLFIMYDGNGREIGTSIEDEILISKSYGFIKRLVDSEKIDRRRLRKINLGDYRYILLANKSTRDVGLIMLLSISDNPIEDLISYLK